MSEVIGKLTQRYDLVLIDTPPLALSPDTEMLATLADAVILVVGASSARLGEVWQVARHLERLNPSMIGVLINRVDPQRDARTAALLAEYQTGSPVGAGRGIVSWLWK